MNSKLNGKYFKLPTNILDHLTKTVQNYNKTGADKNVQGYGQIKSLANSGQISYSYLKKIKSIFNDLEKKGLANGQSLSEIQNTVEYKLNGGKAFKQWIDSFLSNKRDIAKNQETNKKRDNETKDDDSYRPKNKAYLAKPATKSDQIISNKGVYESLQNIIIKNLRYD